MPATPDVDALEDVVVVEVEGEDVVEVVEAVPAGAASVVTVVVVAFDEPLPQPARRTAARARKDKAMGVRISGEIMLYERQGTT